MYCYAFLLLFVAIRGNLVIVNAQENVTVPISSPAVPVPVAVPVQLPTVSTPNAPATNSSPIGTPIKAPLPAPVPSRPCYTNLTEIEDLIALKNPFVLETYILCPNTTYTIGVINDDFQIENGYNPLNTRSNSIFQCGEDGKSSNNCVITGGAIQIFHSYLTFNQENKVNVVIKGITFENAIDYCAFLVAPGDITFSDCIFRVSYFVRSPLT
jgi:hypothetical protein